jgi:hypothetical protein
MGQNDLIHLESNFKNWSNERAQGLKGVSPFLYYCVEQFLKPFDLSDEEVLYGITDGGMDGGIDAIYILANRGQLVRDDADIDPKTISQVHLLVIQHKSNNGFSPIEINKLFFFLDDLLDLSRDVSSFSSKYHAHLLEIMRTFKEKYLQIAGQFPRVLIDYYYLTKGDETKPDVNALDAAAKVRGKIRQHLSKAQCEFHFINAQGLLEQVMLRPPRQRMLVWSESPMQTKEGYVGLVKLGDFASFLKDDRGELADRIFESNVRGFQQNTPVNLQIRQSLKVKQANFWLLNNGITIIAANQQNAGHLRVNLEDPQIVNGLQTSREIFRYFSEDKPEQDDRAILVKVIETADSVTRDAVIKATNSQNKMPPASLRATDPIHHQIEDLFKQYDLYYDRQKGFYKDKGKPIKKIVSVIELVQAVVAVLLQRPDDARARPGDYIKDDKKYDSVFASDTSLSVFLTSVRILHRVEEFLEALELDRGLERNLKFYVAAYLACKLCQHANPSADQILTVDTTTIDGAVLHECYTRVKVKYDEQGGNDVVARGPDLARKLKTELKRRLGKKSRALVAKVPQRA